MKFVAGVLLVLLSQLAHSQTLCKSSERVVFSCNMKSKILSLCSSKNLSRDSGYLQYRFGNTSKIELSFPEDEIHPKGIFFYNGVATPGGILRHVSFKNGSYSYVVFDDTYNDNDNINNNAELAGVSIIQNEKVIKTLHCSSIKNRTEMNLSTMSREDESYIFQRADFLFGPELFE